MQEELRKSLTDLIDETLLELEELKKSRFAASEIKLEGPGDGIAGKPSNGDLHAKKEDKDEDEDEAEKAEGHNRQSDPNGSKHKPVAGEGMEDTHGRHSESPGSGKSRDMSGHNSEADPGETQHQSPTVSKKDDDDDDDKKDKDAKGGERHEAEEKKAIGKLANLAGMKKGDSPSPEQVDADVQKLVMHGLKKSQQETEDLLKGFVEERVKPLESKLETILELVNKIAEQPVPAKGVTANAVPLRKSGEDGAEELSKGEVASKLFELKKSGTKVDSLDITKADLGQDLAKIVAKYKIS